MSIEDKLSELLQQYRLGRTLYKVVRSDAELLAYIQKLVPNSEYLPEQLYCILNKETPLCSNGQRKKFKDTWAGYYRCGKKRCECFRQNHSQKISKAKKSYDQTDWDQIIEKRKATNLKKYGKEFAVQSNSVKEKIASSNIKKYGVKTTLLIPEVQEKIKQKILERYGKEDISKVPALKEKAMKTCLEKYGHVVFPHSVEGRSIVRKSLIERHNVASIAQLKFSPDVRKLLQDTDLFHKEYYDLGIHGLCEKYPELNYDMCRAKLIREGITDVIRYSKPEEFIKNILDKNNIKYAHKTRKIIKPLELDFYCEDQALAIEVCGLYWHQIEKVKDVNYHLNKLNLCLNKNIQLITIFSDFISEKPDIVESRICSKLGLIGRTDHARKLVITNTLAKKQLSHFLNSYHLQGSRLGLFNLAAIDSLGNIKAVMTFGPTRTSLGNKTKTKNVYEMYRFAVAGQIPGIASKLFKYFLDTYNPEIVISYSDRCWGEGQLYTNLGFARDSITRPNYWYTNNFISKQHRYTYTKHKLVAGGFDPAMTEFQIMEQRGFARIYDCGSIKYVWKKSH